MKGIVELGGVTFGSGLYSVGCAQKIAEAIQQSNQDGFSRGIAMEKLQDAVLNFRHQIFRSAVLDDNDIVFDWYPENIDVSDNAKQMKVIKHHYLNELGEGRSINELLKDYRDDTVIYELINDKPTTHRGLDGVVEAMKDLFSLLHTDDDREHPKVDLQHIKVNQNHAQVIWKFETPQHATVYGTDSFAFDENDRIKSQSIVAISQEHPPTASASSDES